jgi:hypothetical protein
MLTTSWSNWKQIPHKFFCRPPTTNKLTPWNLGTKGASISISATLHGYSSYGDTVASVTIPGEETRR